MPEMTVSCDSGSTWTLNVGSSRVNRFMALLKLGVSLVCLGLIEREMTGSGTNMEV